MNSYEKLSVLVQQYECLYDKRSPLYKDKHGKKTWREIAGELDITEENAQKDFENMKKLYLVGPYLAGPYWPNFWLLAN